MARMTEEEASALDKKWTETTPKIGPNGSGFIAKRKAAQNTAHMIAIEETSQSTLADGKTDTYDVTEGVKIQWKNQSIIFPAIVVPDTKDILLGALPLEAMDLMVDPVHEQLVGVHSDQPLHVLYAMG